MPDRGRGLFFFHNPKAGGSSIRRVLGSLFPSASHCPPIENTERDHERRAGSYREFRGYRHYAGHYGHDIFQTVADRHDPISNFRDPAARLLSLYNFYRIQIPLPEDPVQRDDLYPVAFAKQVDFHRFVASDDPRIEIHTRNHHVRQLTSSVWDPNSRGTWRRRLRCSTGCRGSSSASTRSARSDGRRRCSAAASPSSRARTSPAMAVTGASRSRR